MLSNVIDKIRNTIRGVFDKHGIYGELENSDVEELILLTHPECPSCQELKEVLAYALQEGYIREVPVTTPEGQKIADIVGYEYPTLVAKVNGNYVKCRYWFEGEDFVFDFDYNVKKK